MVWSENRRCLKNTVCFSKAKPPNEMLIEYLQYIAQRRSITNEKSGLNLSGNRLRPTSASSTASSIGGGGRTKRMTPSTFPPKNSPPIASLRAWPERNLASPSLRGDNPLAIEPIYLYSAR